MATKKATKTAAPTKGKAVVKQPAPAAKSTAVTAPTNLTKRLQTLAGAGMETMTQQDLALPFIKLLQALSPEVQKGHEKRVQGAEVGDFFNTVTNELWKGDEDGDGILVIPCYFEKVYNVWINRDEGGGFVGSFKTREEADEKCKPETESVVDTANHYVLVQQEDGSWTEAVLSMTSTKRTASRKWNSQMKQLKLQDAQGNKFTPPSFARIWHVTSVGTENDKGFFHVPKIEPDEWLDDEETFNQAESFYRMFAELGATLSYENAGEDVKAEDDDEDEGEY
jgi:hypothetical protein